MIIDKTSTITKIVGIICAIAAAYLAFLTFRGFIYYRVIALLACAALAFVCLKGIGKDKEICVGVFGFMAVFEIVRMLLEESFSLQSGLLLLLRILGYISVVAYLLGIIKNKIIPIIGCILVTLFMVMNVYNLVISMRNLGAMVGTNVNLCNGNTIIDIIGIVAYGVPAIAMMVLIAAGVTKFTD